ncbi:MAG: type VI secretion system baseplate subunit TssE [Candidatus Hodarchaeota archaeon]
MQNLSLYKLLVGYFTTEKVEPTDVDRSYFDRLSEDKKIRQSIVENLTMILQTRQGSVLHLPDFGLPDIMQFYIDSGYSFDPLKKQIRETILKYEPRIEKVRVEEPHFDKDNLRIFLKIVATIRDYSGTEILLTEFSTTGWTKVAFEKDLK